MTTTVKESYRSTMDSLSRFIWIMLPVVLVIATIIYVPMKLNDKQGYARVQQIKTEIKSLEIKNRKIKRENISLRSQIRAIHSDPNYIENIARNEMGMIAPDEVVYQF